MSNANMNNVPTVGLYRHFKGAYYYVTGCSKSATDESTILVNYFNVCHPEYGNFSRPVEDFIADHDTTWQFGDEMTMYIKDRKDNVTGQIHRFERVHDLNFQLGSISTEQIIDELAKRTDSPIHELDIEGLNSNIDCKDYVLGQHYKGENYIATVNSFNTESQAKIYLATHKVNSETHLYKRTFIRIK